MATFERKVDGGRIVGLTADLLTENNEKEIKIEEVVAEKVATPKSAKKPSTAKTNPPIKKK